MLGKILNVLYTLERSSNKVKKSNLVLTDGTLIGSANPLPVSVSGNSSSTTGDTGVKIASFSGAAQTNTLAKGAIITVLLGTVSGTTPTLNATLQWSPDGGTTWLNMGAASGNATSTGNAIVFLIYPTNFSVAGATPAALTTGATATVQLNTILPRTWRLNYVIGGTTPSFALTATYINYQL